MLRRKGADVDERQRIRRLLEDINAGRTVDPQEIDRALDSAERPF